MRFAWTPGRKEQMNRFLLLSDDSNCPNILRFAAVAAFLALFTVFSNSCGYRFSGSGEMPGDIRRIAIETFDNRSGETGIESIITNDVINEFTRSPTVEVAGKEDAEAVLTGVIRASRTRSISHRSAYTTTEREITIVVDVALTTPGGEVLWSARGIEASGDYAVSHEKIWTEQNKKSALADLSARLAQRIFYRLTDRF